MGGEGKPVRLVPVVLVLLAASLRAGEPTEAAWQDAVRAFEEDYGRRSIKFKVRAIDSLPTGDVRTVPFLIEKKALLQHDDWRIRAAAAERLGKIEVPDLRARMRAYAEHPDKRVREGILLALGLSRGRLDGPVILNALADESWEVRRMACFAAGRQRLREAVAPMIDRIHAVDPQGRVLQEGETHPRVHSVLLFNLREITGRYFHTDVERWRAFWQRHRTDLLTPLERFGKQTAGDVTFEVDDTLARAGAGPLVVALPATRRSAVYYQPYLNRWMFVRWLFVNPPPPGSVPSVAYSANGAPIYPVNGIVEALEALRRERGIEEMALLAHGFSTWVAAAYARRHPHRVTGLILLNPYANNDIHRRRIADAKRSGDPDAEYWAKVNSDEQRISCRYQKEQYDHFVRSAWLRDPGDLEIAVLCRLWLRPKATRFVVPEFDMCARGSSRTPVLMTFSPEWNPLTGIDNLNRLTRHYPRHVVVKLRKSARLPFMEEPKRFGRALRVFVDKYLR